MHVKITDHKKINFPIMKYSKFSLTLTKGAISPPGNSKYGTDGVKSISDGGGANGGSPAGKPGGGLLRSGRAN